MKPANAQFIKIFTTAEIYPFIQTNIFINVLLAGNEEPTNGRIFDSATVDILDPATNTWSQGPSMTKRRATHDCVVTEYQGVLE